MKKTIFSLLSAAALFVACDPVEEDGNIGGSITVDELIAKSKVTVVNEGGKNINWVKCETAAPVNARWSCVTSATGNYAELQMFALGEQTVKLEALNADGSVIETEFKVNVEELKIPVAPQWDMLTSGSQKTWTWASIGNVWGNGGYQADAPEAVGNGSGEWWGVPASDIAGQAENYGFDPADAGDATMTFTLVGTQILKSSGATGSYSFDMTPSNGSNIGTFTALGGSILFPCQINTGAKVTVYEIARLDHEHLDLIYATPGTGGWGECTHWHFVAK